MKRLIILRPNGTEEVLNVDTFHSWELEEIVEGELRFIDLYNGEVLIVNSYNQDLPINHTATSLLSQDSEVINTEVIRGTAILLHIADLLLT